VFVGFVILVLTGSALCEVKWVTFRSQPSDAEVYLEVGTDRPFPLGNCSEPMALDLSVFDGRRDIKLTFRREGYLDESRVLQSAPVQSLYFQSRDVYPPEKEGPVQLAPATDLKSRIIQFRLWLGQYALALGGFLAVLLGAGGYGIHRFRKLKTEARRSEVFQALTASLDDSDPFCGRVLGEYRILELLGRGGMSRVYRALPDSSLDAEREVAIKILDPELALKEESVKRFRREVAICAELRHPNILTIHDFGEHDSILYLVMDLLKGETLGQRSGGKPVALSTVAEWVQSIVKAISYLHSRDIVHRDLKPDNVFLTKNDTLKLMDFGIARGEQYTVATATHQGLGTPAYMSPEQVEGRFEEASDQYSLGCMVYEWLTGKPPFVDPDAFALAFKHVGQKPRSLRDSQPKLPEEVDAVVLRMLRKAPGARFPSVAEAGEALVAALVGTDRTSS
jgi:hypothetical protein